MRYIAALDYQHLDNGVFLTSLARSLSEQQENEDIHPIIIHSDSEYTERIIQTGVMRDEAIIRSIKDLNKRLVALFADQGVSTVGINPYQHNVITINNGNLKLDHSFLETLPSRSVLLLSTLVQNTSENELSVLDLPRIAAFLSAELDTDQLFLFSKSDESEVFTNSMPSESMQWGSLDPEFRDQQIPDEFVDFTRPVKLTTARDFNRIPSLEHAISIDSADS